MKKQFITLLILAVGSVSLQAKQLTKEQLPEKILTHFNKKHPKTSNVIISEQKHFGQSLYELSFTEDILIRVPDDKGEKLIPKPAQEESAVFYRTDGNFFINSEKIYAFNIIPSVVINGLKTAFPDYKITAAQLIPNPNGAGEEYEITITAQGSSWTVSIDSKGNVINKENLAAPAAAVPADEKPAAKQAVTTPQK